ncbi:MAG: hypothetical protein COW73_06735 [Nitrospirae bacterium CG18_big_fil_WC_8_21_14_2_50_70_55]|nr:hypothetical protein [Deltaproteobacteria bacterium]NCP96738.1 hypothetical protein [Deltaproteobacteria bacterium]NCS73175.1 hypothetical protein [Deltaproteobacteria bacterium]OIP67899.1 MAG: hypothetical protein AUK30_00075 [Nitrospirae bacterium CG2_30_70_394]PIQ04992.1 MAG: hypothetical protein COW73_06735 [Nitrospirae bacterium CG18_big_fil_WC_8_21_14_2_50_70_55]
MSTNVTDKISLHHGEEIVDAVRVRLVVNRLITQDGRLYLTNRRILFSPTGLVDRAVGAAEISVYLPHITNLQVEETALTLQSRTRLYRFEGKQVDLFAAQVQAALKEPAAGGGADCLEKERPAAAPAAASACPTCEQPVRGDFIYCPHCQEQLIAPVCPHCHRPVEEGWTFCPSCRCAL